MVYRFYDTDSQMQNEYDIQGEQYQKLLDVCFLYCQSVSFVVRTDHHHTDLFPNYMEKYKAPIPKDANMAYRHYGFAGKYSVTEKYEIRCYYLSEPVKEYLRHKVDSMFEWICGWGFLNPEDPAFFREDGSIFFYSTIHEGVCTLIPGKTEYVSNIIINEGWLLSEVQV